MKYWYYEGFTPPMLSISHVIPHASLFVQRTNDDDDDDDDMSHHEL